MSLVNKFKTGIECKYKINDSRLYTCVVSKDVIVRLHKEIREFKGKHLPEKEDDSVKVVLLMEAIVNHFPRSLNMVFKNLTRLEMFKCGLNEISQRDLLGFENLDMLYLGSNHLTSLPDNLLENMPEIKYLSFKDNKITHMSSKLLEPVKEKLEFANFSNNVRINYLFSLNSGSVAKLMTIIDAQCIKPIEEMNAETKAMRSFCEGFKSLFESGRFSDLTIIVGSKKIQVHKIVLASRSSVFARMFENDMKENLTGSITIEDFSVEAVEDFLKFIYNVNFIKETNAMELFALGSKYDIEDLTSVCEEHIMNNLMESNAFEIFTFGHLYSSKKMKDLAFNEISKMFPGRLLNHGLVDQDQHTDLKELIDAKRFFEDILEKHSTKRAS